MNSTGLLADSRLAILGLGLMGGSLALALRGKCAWMIGVDPDPETRSLARQMAVVDQVFADPSEAFHGIDVVILAAPVRAILRLLSDLPDLHPGHAVVLDLGSTKTEIIGAMAALPDRLDPIGGHPMCGKEKSSLRHAEASLFQGAPFAFIPLVRTTPRARSLAVQLASTVGAKPLWLDHTTHDRWTAATSHLPHLVASALALATPLEAAPLVGPGFRSTARLAGASPEMMLDILLTNQTHLLTALSLFRKQLDQLESHLVGGDALALAEILAQAVSKRCKLTAD